MSNETSNQTTSAPAVVSSDLLAAIELALDEWAWIQGGAREPLSFTLRRPENEIKVFKMVVSMNNLKRQYGKWKAANTPGERPAYSAHPTTPKTL